MAELVHWKERLSHVETQRLAGGLLSLAREAVREALSITPWISLNIAPKFHPTLEIFNCFQLLDVRALALHKRNLLPIWSRHRSPALVTFRRTPQFWLTARETPHSSPTMPDYPTNSPLSITTSVAGILTFLAAILASICTKCFYSASKISRKHNLAKVLRCLFQWSTEMLMRNRKGDWNQNDLY